MSAASAIFVPGATWVSQPRADTYSSQNAKVLLGRSEGDFANVRIIVNYPHPNLTITEYKSGGMVNSYTITNPYEIDYILTDLDAIALNDPTATYDIIVVTQYVRGDPSIMQQFRDLRFISLASVPSANIVSPLDNDRVATAPQEDIIEFTSVPYTVPANGRIVFQVEGTGNVATVSFNNNSTTYQLNSGSTLANGAIYEFSVAVAAGDVFTVSGATFIRGFFIQGVMA